MKKWQVPLLSALVLCASLGAAPAADAPLVLGMMEIRGLDTLSSSAFELSKAAGSPMPKEMVSMMLYGALGTMPGMGIPADGTVRAVAFNNGSDQGGLAVLLPVENEGADYLSGLGQNGWKNESETADGLLHFTPPDGSGMAWNEVYFLKRGPTLIAAKTAEDARLADAASSALPPILAVEGDLAIQIRPAALAEAFGPLIAEQMDKAFKEPGVPTNAAAMGELYGKAYLAAAKQVDEFVVGLSVADGNLNVHTRLAPAAGTALARWFETVKSPSAATAVVALPDALGVETLNLGNLDLLAPAYFRFVDEVLKAMPSSLGPETLSRYLENEKTCYAQLAGDFGFALLPPTKECPLRFAEYVALKDSAILRARVPEMVQAANDMFKAAMAIETNSPLPFEIGLVLGEPREYREIAVDKLTYSIVPGQALAAMWPKSIPAKFDVELAWVPGGLLAGIGDAALTDALVDRALDGAAAPLTDLPAWKAAYPDPDAELVDVAHLALFDAVRAYLALGDSSSGGGNAALIPATPGNLESASYRMEGLMTRLRFRLADIAAIGEKVKEAQAQAMAEMQRQMEAQGATSFEDESAAEPEIGEPPAEPATGEEAAPAEEPPAEAPVPPAAE